MPIGTTELLILVSIGMVLFGSTQVTRFARTLGRSQKEFTQAWAGEVVEESEADSVDAVKELSAGKHYQH